MEANVTALSAILEVELRRRNQSIRQISDEIGVTHTTMIRALKGKQVGFDTILKIANWLDVSPTVLINAEGKGEDALINQVALILKAEPRLGKVLQEALDRIADGRMSPEVFRDLAAYAAYRLDTVERIEQDEAKGDLDQ
jgi:transcriptional regulator with XRE-family HTH domain